MSAASVVGIGLGHGLHWSTLYLVAVPVYVGLLLFVAVKLKRHGKAGVVTVQVKNKRITLRAGKRYLAKPPR